MIRFLKSPTGEYPLAYNEGDTASLDKKLEGELIEKGIATDEIAETTGKDGAGGLRADTTSLSKGKTLPKRK